jgi:hypothetical protein
MQLKIYDYFWNFLFNTFKPHLSVSELTKTINSNSWDKGELLCILPIPSAQEDTEAGATEVT